jgi:integrase
MIGSSADSCERVATAEEAAKLIEALRAAGGSGALSWDADEIMVAASKSDAGEGRRVPMVGPLKRILGEEWMRVGRPAKGAIVVRSVDSGKWQARADREWEAARLARVTLHEARHTYASFLMAAGYNLKQIQEYLGHADLVTTGRYIKNLPVPRGTTARQKLDAYLASEVGDL